MSDTLQIPQATSPLMTWLSYLGNLHTKAIDMGLERVGKLGNQLGLLNPAPKVITVSGTNGKGTTCHTLESVFLAAGLKVGVYSSPHLVRYTERVRIQGKEPTEQDFCRVFADIEAQRGDISLTYFEYGTLAALQLFKEADLDVVILEVGLGGRLDATNIVDADIAAITSIALDHTDWLGNDREHIGREKAGIFRRGRFAVVGELDMPLSIAEVADELGAKLFRRGPDWNFSADENSWNWSTEGQQFDGLPIPNLPLANAATAMGVIHCLLQQDDKVSRAINEQAIHSGLRNAQLPGRFQIIRENPRVILDVAHNPHAAGYLVQKLAELPRSPNSKIRGVVGMLEDKDIAGTLACLSQQIDEWYCASLHELRGAEASVLAGYLAQARTFTEVEPAWQQAMEEASAQDIIVVCGSFHTVAHVMEALEEEKRGE
ncbi:bifunctional tetrahydrofolate synthase/dihydrofolate synthase [Xenorhabdus szentirmaii]|uniref:Dihydrofolate synthase/folylpolyglutamate synthase n=1 Tax=Xenorhabdus szentirmaii DSM 16338 TaxID=1427518 RepID=W1IVH4_9GAMM|nr:MULTISPECIES: bifunctional tetrahydrofolate synthase/dihydrofolate synthase [Xenorhabdus]MBD2792295.1 bifunctional tetrahydrofolate synthase/dihydrofolate synthase [Xenorhabdus sp. CUL]MBD2819291.1 bifunctional tetrahydrofolate synthase/dihydrofolate synthase [Xenorhabdus sp. 42]MBD2823724.1 bifunctional tetrahydrofolate synthase/dihydrofolate synthase [Xenorhabdus sp. 5]PHM33002.1 bifunctional tetrahydrofolate synthase/dihydrofolate synthase [Xenorhabdus szentirmaii DSM 16338]PHM40674.1 bi